MELELKRVGFRFLKFVIRVFDELGFLDSIEFNEFWVLNFRRNNEGMKKELKSEW
jgi:hypothetical protein